MKLLLTLSLLPSLHAFTFSPSPRPPTSLRVLSDKATSKVWSPDSWREFTPHQMPVYEDEGEVKEAVDYIEKSSPLVFAGEVR